MSDIQYTIRAVPKDIDAYLRGQARLRRMSLNQTVLEYIDKAVRRDKSAQEDDFSWLIGSGGIDESSLDAIQAAKTYDKQKQQHRP